MFCVIKYIPGQKLVTMCINDFLRQSEKSH